MLLETVKKFITVTTEKGIKFSLNLLSLEISNRLELSRVYGLPKHAQIETSKVPNKRLKILYRRFFYGFYLRPSFLMKHLWHYKNFYFSNFVSWKKLASIILGRWSS